MLKVIQYQSAYKAPAILCAVIIFTHILAIVLPGDLNGLGIRPRKIFGLVGIVFSPFLHSGLPHLISNIPPLFIMGYFVSALDPKSFIPRTIALIACSGLLTWLISSSGIVIGASGLVFAYWSFLIVYGFREKSIKSLLIAIGTILVYGTLIFSLFKYAPGISWAGHLSGAIAGFLLAVLITRERTTIKH